MYAEFPYANPLFSNAQLIHLDVIFGAGAGSDLLKSEILYTSIYRMLFILYKIKKSSKSCGCPPHPPIPPPPPHAHTCPSCLIIVL